MEKLPYSKRGALSDIWPILNGKVWHQTPTDLFARILETGTIEPDPDILPKRRWKSQKPDIYPYVRHIGGVSLFDFRKFDPATFEVECGMCNWYEFIPYLERDGNATWINIDQHSDEIRSRFWSPTRLWERQDGEKAWRHTLMPRLEACVIGPLPKSAFLSAFEISAQDMMAKWIAL